ncbi:hypothetical protein SAMN02910292_01446, partial [Lachnospiraceae bacterium XBB2008]
MKSKNIPKCIREGIFCMMTGALVFAGSTMTVQAAGEGNAVETTAPEPTGTTGPDPEANNGEQPATPAVTVTPVANGGTDAEIQQIVVNTVDDNFGAQVSTITDASGAIITNFHEDVDPATETSSETTTTFESTDRDPSTLVETEVGTYTEGNQTVHYGVYTDGTSSEPVPIHEETTTSTTEVTTNSKEVAEQTEQYFSDNETEPGTGKIVETTTQEQSYLGGRIVIQSTTTTTLELVHGVEVASANLDGKPCADLAKFEGEGDGQVLNGDQFTVIVQDKLDGEGNYVLNEDGSKATETILVQTGTRNGQPYERKYDETTSHKELFDLITGAAEAKSVIKESATIHRTVDADGKEVTTITRTYTDENGKLQTVTTSYEKGQTMSKEDEAAFKKTPISKTTYVLAGTDVEIEASELDDAGLTDMAGVKFTVTYADSNSEPTITYTYKDKDGNEVEKTLSDTVSATLKQNLINKANSGDTKNTETYYTLGDVTLDASEVFEGMEDVSFNVNTISGEVTYKDKAGNDVTLDKDNSLAKKLVAYARTHGGESVDTTTDGSFYNLEKIEQDGKLIGYKDASGNIYSVADGWTVVPGAVQYYNINGATEDINSATELTQEQIDSILNEVGNTYIKVLNSDGKTWKKDVSGSDAQALLEKSPTLSQYAQYFKDGKLSIALKKDSNGKIETASEYEERVNGIIADMKRDFKDKGFTLSEDTKVQTKTELTQKQLDEDLDATWKVVDPDGKQIDPENLGAMLTKAGLGDYVSYFTNGTLTKIYDLKVDENGVPTETEKEYADRVAEELGKIRTALAAKGFTLSEDAKGEAQIGLDKSEMEDFKKAGWHVVDEAGRAIATADLVQALTDAGLGTYADY